MELHWMKVYPGNLLMRVIGLSYSERGQYFEAVFYLWQTPSLTRAEMEQRIGAISDTLLARFDAREGDKLGLDWLDSDRVVQAAAATKNSKNRSGKRKSSTGISTGNSTRKRTPVPFPVPIPSTAFEEWYARYGKKRGKQQALEQWSKLSEADQSACMQRTPLFLTANPEPKYRPDPERFLKNKRWEDEATPMVSANGGPRAGTWHKDREGRWVAPSGRTEDELHQVERALIKARKQLSAEDLKAVDEEAWHWSYKLNGT